MKEPRSSPGTSLCGQKAPGEAFLPPAGRLSSPVCMRKRRLGIAIVIHPPTPADWRGTRATCSDCDVTKKTLLREPAVSGMSPSGLRRKGGSLSSELIESLEALARGTELAWLRRALQAGQEAQNGSRKATRQ
eukprot:scaffold2265_cov198-Pinguiococcus_pyrenoidosus.AAC.2